MHVDVFLTRAMKTHLDGLVWWSGRDKHGKTVKMESAVGTGNSGQRGWGVGGMDWVRVEG